MSIPMDLGRAEQEYRVLLLAFIAQPGLSLTFSRHSQDEYSLSKERRLPLFARRLRFSLVLFALLLIVNMFSLCCKDGVGINTQGPTLIYGHTFSCTRTELLWSLG